MVLAILGHVFILPSTKHATLLNPFLSLAH